MSSVGQRMLTFIVANKLTLITADTFLPWDITFSKLFFNVSGYKKFNAAINEIQSYSRRSIHANKKILNTQFCSIIVFLLSTTLFDVYLPMVY